MSICEINVDGIQDSGFRFQVSGFRFQVSGFSFSFRFRVSSFEVSRFDPGFGFPGTIDPGFGIEVRGDQLNVPQYVFLEYMYTRGAVELRELAMEASPCAARLAHRWPTTRSRRVRADRCARSNAISPREF